MIVATNEQLDQMLAEAMDELPKTHLEAVKNVAIVWADEPTESERHELQLADNMTLFGLYQGVPLAKRQGRVNDYPPGKITIYRGPIMRSVNSLPELKEQLKHTLWHEIAHYFGLDHEQIHKLEQK
ncbi:MAG TPA: metallopeptidase family protein [Candidatus Binatia bacterium]|nr:metallopeptidase family protein [Candidatus Binatia bacterium]